MQVTRVSQQEGGGAKGCPGGPGSELPEIDQNSGGPASMNEITLRQQAKHSKNRNGPWVGP
jgi:hypothetical protein